MRRRLKRLFALIATVLVGMAVWRELNTPSALRTWHGRVAGVPYDFRPPTFDRIKEASWSPEDPHVLKPQAFGLGWTVNLGRLVSLLSGGRERILL